VDGNGNVEFKEEDGIDYAPVTVQMPGGERVPFLFTIKELSAKGSLEGFGGDFVVPSYRGSSFLDPKARPAARGAAPPGAERTRRTRRRPAALWACLRHADGRARGRAGPRRLHRVRQRGRAARARRRRGAGEGEPEEHGCAQGPGGLQRCQGARARPRRRLREGVR